MYTLYIANKNYSSWSLRPWLLMTELAIPFAERLEHFSDNLDDFRRFSPSGRVPCLHDGGTVVYDSLAIVEYLAERHAGVWPADGAARNWARCACAEMHSGFTALRNICGMNCGLRVRLNEVSPALRADLDRMEQLWGEGLKRFGGPFLAGDKFTAVDAFFGPVAFRFQSYRPPVGDGANGYVRRLLALPAMQRWYADALKEPWRDAGHDADVAAVGMVVEDLRVRA
jgi:glutathione S-transferase